MDASSSAALAAAAPKADDASTSTSATKRKAYNVLNLVDLAASIDVPEPVPEKKARDGSESGSDIEDVPEDKPLYLLPENQHHPPEFLTGAAPQRFPVHIAGT